MALKVLALSVRRFRIGLESSVELSYNRKGCEGLAGSLVQPSTQSRNPQDLPKNKWPSSLCLETSRDKSPRRQLFHRFVEVQHVPPDFELGSLSARMGLALRSCGEKLPPPRFPWGSP